jgi:hypothetical protein
MPVKYSCFISYPHGSQGNFWESIMKQLKCELENRIGPLLDETIYMDNYELKIGVNLDKELAKAICQSVCMIVVFTPLYESRSGKYGLREFLAMRRIEDKRMAILSQHGFNTNHRMIIPIVVKGDPDEELPPEIKKITHYDISKILLTGELNTPEFRDKLFEIVQHIYKNSKNIKELEKKGVTQDCDSSELPTVEEACIFWGMNPVEGTSSSGIASEEPKEIEFPLRSNSE